MTVRELKNGEEGVLLRIAGEGKWKRRLYEMGLLPGTAFRLVRKAPLGGPFQLELRGYSLTLRGGEAERLLAAREGASVYPLPRADFAACAEPPRPGKVHTLALIGNPNCGKTTLFNALTGARREVGNFPGVTVTKTVGLTLKGNIPLCDLPGSYSLVPCSREEAVARDYLTEERPGGIINVVDGANLERNLYLTLQLLELGLPTVVAVNMMDELRSKGLRLDCAALSRELGVPVIPVSAKTGENISRLLQTAKALVEQPPTALPPVRYDAETEEAAARMGGLLPPKIESRRFYVLRLLEGDTWAAGRLTLTEEENQRAKELAVEYERRAEEMGESRETLLAAVRFAEGGRIASACLQKGIQREKKALSAGLDRIVMGKYTALPVFLAAMAGLFALTFGRLGSLLTAGLERIFFGWLIPGCRLLLAGVGAPEWCGGLLTDAILGGIAGVLRFLPQIALLFLGLALLEDSGYLARAAFLADGLLRRLGVSGRAVVPLLMGFGCTTPAVMAARTMESEAGRRRTIQLTPFLSCGARLPIYALFASAFFPGCSFAVVFSMYLLGVLVALLLALLLRSVSQSAKAKAPFLLELPPYRLPALQTVFRHVCAKCAGFVRKAGGVIFGMNVLLWLLSSFTPTLAPALAPEESLLAAAGGLLAPLLTPLGFGSWQAAVALLTGLLAKESVAGTLTMLCAGQTGAELSVALHSLFTPASALAFMVFSLLYPPCIAAFMTMKKELGSFRSALGMAALQTAVAWLASLLVYIGARLLL